MNSVQELAAVVGLVQACAALALSRATYYRQQKEPPAPCVRKSPARSLSPEEKAAILDLLHSERFVDQSPNEVYATLLDEGRYLGSVRTMYRILAENQEVRERRAQRKHPVYQKPELMATGPNQVWSWDITKLRGPSKGIYYHLYVILDIYSRYVVGWLVAERESGELAGLLVAESYKKQGIEPDQVCLHADNGPAMTSQDLSELMANLGISKSHSRPYVSDDNPYSESQFKTLKYRPEFPERFGSLEDTRLFLRGFFAWYNKEHHHVGIGLLTPEVVHYGQAQRVIAQRQQVLLVAYHAHPERFVRKPPKPPQLPAAAWINPPKKDEPGDG
jgi:putative transposase